MRWTLTGYAREGLRLVHASGNKGEVQITLRWQPISAVSILMRSGCCCLTIILLRSVHYAPLHCNELQFGNSISKPTTAKRSCQKLTRLLTLAKRHNKSIRNIRHPKTTFFGYPKRYPKLNIQTLTSEIRSISYF